MNDPMIEDLTVREPGDEAGAQKEQIWLRGRREYQWFHENRARIEEIIRVLQ